jgi:two-component system sensor histidine kinase KdpD
MLDPRIGPLLRAVAAVVGPLVAVTAIVVILERNGIDDASPVYLLAVVVSGVVAGPWPAVATAVGAFLLYDLLFVHPHYTLAVDDPQEWLNLLLLLIVGVVVGRLAGAERDRAETAIAREREARALFRISFALASARLATDAMPQVADVVCEAVDCRRLWIEVADRVLLDTGEGPRPSAAVQNVLTRRPGDQPAEWTRVHRPDTRGVSAKAREGRDLFRVKLSSAETTFGSVWFERERLAGTPTGGETRVIAAAADQLGRAMERDRLAAAAADAEVARGSDRLKSALLDSVSHDLRTPLASIRAAAGTLIDDGVERSDAERREIAESIDLEADRLNRLVSNLLDMSRIEAGELHPSTSAFVLADLVDAATARAGILRRSANVTIDVPNDLPPVEVDDVLFGQVLANILENVDRYAGDDAAVVVRARPDEEHVVLTVDDAGPGVPDESVSRLFEKFYRVPRPSEGSRRGTGTGLAVVLGLMTAMDGSATAGRSHLGGLRVELAIPIAAVPRANTPGLARAELRDG